jgi:hypothetical protein
VLSAIGFNDLTNTTTVSSATLSYYYWDELQGIPALTLLTPATASDQSLAVSAAGTAAVGSRIQLGQEILQVTAVQNNGAQYQVTRGVDGTTPADYPAGTPIFALAQKTVIAPFPPDFFGSPYSGSWTFPIAAPDIRVAGAELFVTNMKGNSPTTGIFLTHNDDNGLRTLSGGQYSIQVEGYLAVEDSVGPALSIETAHSVGDIYAILGQAADAVVNLQLNLNGAAYCTLSFAPGAIVSNSVDGLTLPFLPAGGKLTLSILSVGQTYPGADLTVVIRI